VIPEKQTIEQNYGISTAYPLFDSNVSLFHNLSEIFFTHREKCFYIQVTYQTIPFFTRDHLAFSAFKTSLSQKLGSFFRPDATPSQAILSSNASYFRISANFSILWRSCLPQTKTPHGKQSLTMRHLSAISRGA